MQIRRDASAAAEEGFRFRVDRAECKDPGYLPHEQTLKALSPQQLSWPPFLGLLGMGLGLGDLNVPWPNVSLPPKDGGLQGFRVCWGAIPLQSLMQQDSNSVNSRLLQSPHLYAPGFKTSFSERKLKFRVRKKLREGLVRSLESSTPPKNTTTPVNPPSQKKRTSHNESTPPEKKTNLVSAYTYIHINIYIYIYTCMHAYMVYMNVYIYIYVLN